MHRGKRRLAKSERERGRERERESLQVGTAGSRFNSALPSGTPAYPQQHFLTSGQMARMNSSNGDLQASQTMASCLMNGKLPTLSQQPRSLPSDPKSLTSHHVRIPTRLEASIALHQHTYKHESSKGAVQPNALSPRPFCREQMSF
ncbi:hypothetical protein O6H91_16G049300 [Diphasiastrum complanatum]|uniref:Uncharacterized protein n=1 Tax=Diphasiastrum complanatum TaxID=34168 RepID=A0ACC2BC48_DIPCM|nr:hypothetical protein O6H91_16G049300 [Diphasiastrum complanatum]